MKIEIPNCKDCSFKNTDSCKAVYLNDSVYCTNGINDKPYKTTSSHDVFVKAST